MDQRVPAGTVTPNRQMGKIFADQCSAAFTMTIAGSLDIG
jgi:hypothetical protein